jgi:hypothetical protein
MCPDWFNGRRARRMECEAQIRRMGRRRYEALVAKRGNAERVFNSVDFGDLSF